MNQEDYDNYFERQNAAKDKSKWNMAFEKAHDIRKFEIDLYWKRTTYFWTLLAAILAGYFLLLSSDDDKVPHKDVYLTLIASVGLVFSCAWHLAAKGSKFWQENWENHLDLLEDEVTGPLYKTVLKGTHKPGILSSNAPYSVSKINHWISIFLAIICIGLMITPIVEAILKAVDFLAVFTGESIGISIIIEFIIIMGSIVFLLFMWNSTKSDLNDESEKEKTIVIIKRTTKLK